MRRFLAVVEGPHDANFMGVVLRRKGFAKVKLAARVDATWGRLMPKIFPVGPRLSHVVDYPDIYEDVAGDRSLAVLVAKGDTKLVSTLRGALENLDVPALAGICIVADADDFLAARRLAQLQDALAALNASHGPGGVEGGATGLRGFPLQIPTGAKAVAPGMPRVGIFVLPDGHQPGTLDAVLLDCARTSLAAIYSDAKAFVAAAEQAVATDDRFKPLRKPAGVVKATAGVLGNLLLPGTALATSVEQAEWFAPLKGDEAGFQAFSGFVDALLA